MLHFCQPYVRLTALLSEMPHTFHAAPSQANKGGHHECTPKHIRIWNVLVFHFLKVKESLNCSANLEVCWKLFGLHRAQSHFQKFLCSFSTLTWPFVGFSCSLTGWGMVLRILFRDCDLENTMGGEREGRVGEKGVLLQLGLFWWGLLMWWLLWKGLCWGCCNETCWEAGVIFFSISLGWVQWWVTPLSLLFRFRLTSISSWFSCCFSCYCFCWWLGCYLFYQVFLFPGNLSPSFFQLVLMVPRFQGGCTASLLVMLMAAAYSGQLLARCQNYLQDQQSGILPSTSTIICWSL